MVVKMEKMRKKITGDRDRMKTSYIKFKGRRTPLEHNKILRNVET